MRLLVLSSVSLFIPAVVSIFKKNVIKSVVCSITSITSINFWRNEDYESWRLKIDKTMAYLSFFYHTHHGLQHVDNLKILALSLITGFYSCSYIRYPNTDWRYFHALFHLSSVFGMLI